MSWARKALEIFILRGRLKETLNGSIKFGSSINSRLSILCWEQRLSSRSESLWSLAWSTSCTRLSRCLFCSWSSCWFSILMRLEWSSGQGSSLSLLWPSRRRFKGFSQSIAQIYRQELVFMFEPPWYLLFIESHRLFRPPRSRTIRSRISWGCFHQMLKRLLRWLRHCPQSLNLRLNLWYQWCVFTFSLEMGWLLPWFLS